VALYKKKKLGFTITELVIVLILLLFISSVVTLHTMEQTRQKQNIEKIKDTYSLLEKATIAWQTENNCTDNIKICIENEKSKSGIMFNGIAKYLPVVASTVDVEAKGRVVKAEELAKTKWLPEKTLTYAGHLQKTSTTGVSKYYDSQKNTVAYYLLKNGVTISVKLPDINSNTGFGFFDINGKDGANKIGEDVYPFSLGADLDTNNLLYEAASNKFNPYYAANEVNTNADMCNITSNVCASDNIPSNPTAYVLKTNKLPH